MPWCIPEGTFELIRLTGIPQVKYTLCTDHRFFSFLCLFSTYQTGPNVCLGGDIILFIYLHFVSYCLILLYHIYVFSSGLRREISSVAKSAAPISWFTENGYATCTQSFINEISKTVAFAISLLGCAQVFVSVCVFMLPQAHRNR